MERAQQLPLDWDRNWQKFFAWSGLIFVVLCGLGLEVFMPQPPHFDLSAADTARYYADNRQGVLLGMTLCSISMAFLLAWTIQLGMMLWRLDSGTKVATIVATVSLCSTPMLLALDICFFTIAAYRPDISPEIVRALSDVAWIGSMLIWPPLMLGMAIVGLIILKTQGRPDSFPIWGAWASFIAAAAEPFQAGIVFAKTGVFAPDGLMTWYGAVFTWGPWILFLAVAMLRLLARQEMGQVQTEKGYRSSAS